jgi:quinol monooxygenase YgiN
MLILIAKLRVKPGCGQKLIELAERAIEPSHNEEGCITYELLQNPFDPDSFTFYEKWRSREDLESHFNEPHFLEFAGASEDITDGTPSLVSYEVASEDRIM